jgi:hypothetical protein
MRELVNLTLLSKPIHSLHSESIALYLYVMFPPWFQIGIISPIFTELNTQLDDTITPYAPIPCSW